MNPLAELRAKMARAKAKAKARTQAKSKPKAKKKMDKPTTLHFRVYEAKPGSNIPRDCYYYMFNADDEDDRDYYKTEIQRKYIEFTKKGFPTLEKWRTYCGFYGDDKGTYLDPEDEQSAWVIHVTEVPTNPQWGEVSP